MAGDDKGLQSSCLAKGKVSFPSGPFYIETKIKFVLHDKIMSVVSYLVTGQTELFMAVNGNPSFRKMRLSIDFHCKYPLYVVYRKLHQSRHKMSGIASLLAMPYASQQVLISLQYTNTGTRHHPIFIMIIQWACGQSCSSKRRHIESYLTNSRKYVS